MNTKPQTLADLRDLVLGISKGQVDIALGAKALDVLAKLVDVPERSAVHSISELGEWLAVNPSTLTRLSKRLGYDGFNDLQDVFRAAVTDHQRHFYSHQTGRLIATKSARDEEADIVARIGRETSDNIDGFLSQLDSLALRDVASKLASARRVRVYGLRQFHAFAAFMVYGLNMLRADAALLDASNLGVAEALAQLEKGDVVVVASCEPYTQVVADVAVVAASQGLDVVAITDKRSSPLVAPSCHAFFVPHASSFFSNSMGAYIAFCEGLLNLVARCLGNGAVDAMKRRETLISALKIEA